MLTEGNKLWIQTGWNCQFLTTFLVFELDQLRTLQIIYCLILIDHGNYLVLNAMVNIYFDFCGPSQIYEGCCKHSVRFSWVLTNIKFGLGCWFLFPIYVWQQDLQSGAKHEPVAINSGQEGRYRWRAGPGGVIFNKVAWPLMLIHPIDWTVLKDFCHLKHVDCRLRG